MQDTRIEPARARAKSQSFTGAWACSWPDARRGSVRKRPLDQSDLAQNFQQPIDIQVEHRVALLGAEALVKPWVKILESLLVVLRYTLVRWHTSIQVLC